MSLEIRKSSPRTAKKSPAFRNSPDYTFFVKRNTFSCSSCREKPPKRSPTRCTSLPPACTPWSTASGRNSRKAIHCRFSPPTKAATDRQTFGKKKWSGPEREISCPLHFMPVRKSSHYRKSTDFPLLIKNPTVILFMKLTWLSRGYLRFPSHI